MRAILKQSWQIYRDHFPVILALVLAVWTPLELLSSYMDKFVFGEDDVKKSLKFAQLLNNFFGIIATAGLIFISQQALTRQRPTFRGALATGFTSWGRMWWTRILWHIALVFAFLLLIIPGIYLFARLALAEPVAVQERISGTAAMRRSFELTQGRFWLMFRHGLALLALFLLPIALIIAMAFVPALDHWLIDAATQIVGDVLTAFATITVAVAYSQFKNEQTPEYSASAISS